MSVREAFAAALAERVLVKDGPYGTAVQALGLDEAGYRGTLAVNREQRGNNDILNLTRPDAIGAICDAYIDAGAEILATNTFSANRISQADYGCEAMVAEINRAAAGIIRDRADRAHARDGRRRFVVGAVGPDQQDAVDQSPGRGSRVSARSTSTGWSSVYREQIDALADGVAWTRSWWRRCSTR